MLQCLLWSTGLEGSLRTWIPWIFLFFSSSSNSMQTCISCGVLHTSLSFVPKCAIKACLWLRNPSDSCHCIFEVFSHNTADCSGCYMVMICKGYTFKAYALKSWLDQISSEVPSQSKLFYDSVISHDCFKFTQKTKTYLNSCCFINFLFCYVCMRKSDCISNIQICKV